MHKSQIKVLQLPLKSLGYFLVIIGIFGRYYLQDFGGTFILSGFACLIIVKVLNYYVPQESPRTNDIHSKPSGSYIVRYKSKSSSSVIRCRYCSSPVDRNTIFCPQCGSQLEEFD
ncbi:MAG: hypothetical protein ACTSR2_09990 [Candidatus Hodarchaeales archaeon]